jgi:hypothetical protein
MSISNFGSLFELMAAINIAFVAVEYTKSYTNILSKKVFKLHDLIASEFKNLKSIIVDRNSIDTITELKINEQSASVEIEKCKRESEKLKAEIETIEKDLLSSVDKQCEFKNFSNSCLWSFLYCIVALFLSGMENVFIENTLVSFLFILLCISILYFSCGWIFGEKENGFIKNYFIRLSFVIGLFVFTFLVAVIFAHLMAMTIFIDRYKNYLILFSAVIPFVNFIAYFSITLKKIKCIKKDIYIKTKDLGEKCKAWSSSADSLISAWELCSKITPEG